MDVDGDDRLACGSLQLQAAVQVSPTHRKELTVGIIAGVLAGLLAFAVGLLIRSPSR